MRRQGGNVNEKFSGKKRSQQRGGPCSGFHFYGNVKGKVSGKKSLKKEEWSSSQWSFIRGTFTWETAGKGFTKKMVWSFTT